MSVIWKAELHVGGICVQMLPLGARVLAVQVQHGRPCVWFLCDPDAAKEERYFRVVGTGLAIESETGTYIDSFQLYGGDFVGHVFDMTALVQEDRRASE